jgi:hypothetical protein
MQCWGDNDYNQATLAAPDAPTNITGEPNNGVVSLRWRAPDFDGGTAVTTYQVYLDTKVVCTSKVPTCIVSGLTNGKSYAFTVVANNDVGASLAVATAAFTPHIILPIPAAPSAVSALPAPTGAVVIGTAAVLGAGVKLLGFQIVVVGVGTFTATKLPYTLTGLNARVTYSLAVSTLSNAGTSQPSASVTVTPGTFLATPAKATIAGKSSVSVTVSNAPAGAVVAIAASGMVTATGIANANGTAVITVSPAKSGVLTATTTVSKVAYKATATVFVPVVAFPAATHSKPATVSISAARPGSTVIISKDGSQVASTVVPTTGKVTYTWTPAVAGTSTFQISADDVIIGKSTVTIK